MKKFFKLIRCAIDRRKALAAVLVLEVYALTLLVGCRGQMARDAARYEAQISALEEVHRTELAELTAKAEAGIYASRYLEAEREGDAHYMAVWLTELQELYPGISQDARAMACWGVICRMESGSYPADALGVLSQPRQFDEFNPEGAATEENMAIAINQLARWSRGDIRPCGEGAVYISISAAGCELRDSFEGGRGANYWRAA